MSDQFLAEVRIFGCNYAPSGWAMCNGQIMAIAQNTALFSLIGVNYGGNGTSNFALPNLQGNAAIHVGGNQPGPGLSPYNLGQTGGTSTVTLNQNQTASHTHPWRANNASGDTATPANDVILGRYSTVYNADASKNLAPLSPASLTPGIGGAQPHNNMQPFVVLNFCIALSGIYPQRP